MSHKNQHMNDRRWFLSKNDQKIEYGKGTPAKRMLAQGTNQSGGAISCALTRPRDQRSQPMAKVWGSGAQPVTGLRALEMQPMTGLRGTGAQPKARLKNLRAQPVAGLKEPGGGTNGEAQVLMARSPWRSSWVWGRNPWQKLRGPKARPTTGLKSLGTQTTTKLGGQGGEP